MKKNSKLKSIENQRESNKKIQGKTSKRKIIFKSKKIQN